MYTASSFRLGEIMGITSHTIRKDISRLGQAGDENGYNIGLLKELIKKGLGFDKVRKACIAGLGRLGSAILNSGSFPGQQIRIAAGFDSNINRLETFSTDIPLFPAVKIPDIVRRDAIELGIITVPAASAQLTAERLIEGGVKGILNFAPVVIQNTAPDVFIRNFHVLDELRMLSVLVNMKEEAE